MTSLDSRRITDVQIRTLSLDEVVTVEPALIAQEAHAFFTNAGSTGPLTISQATGLMASPFLTLNALPMQQLFTAAHEGHPRHRPIPQH